MTLDRRIFGGHVVLLLTTQCVATKRSLQQHSSFSLRLQAFSFFRQLDASQKQPQVIYSRSNESEDSRTGMQHARAGAERNERAAR